jgi:membrane protease YdiL (CAAX protease family)
MMFKKLKMKINYTKKIILIISLFALINIFSKIIISSDNKNIFVLQSILKLSFLIITCYLISKDNTYKLNLLFKNKTLSFTISILLIYFSVNHINSEIIIKKIHINEWYHFSYFIQCITTGLFEEFFCRILLFGLVCNILRDNNYGNYYKEILITSLIFGLLHLTNLFNIDYDIISVINQVMFAFVIGVLLQCILIRFKNIILTSVLHGLINYNSMANTKLFKMENTASPSINTLDDFMQSFITFIILCLIVFTLGYFLVRNRKMEIIKL